VQLIKKVPAFIWAALFALIWYGFTLAPTVLWGDPAKLAIFSYKLQLGLHAAAHPLHTVIGWAWGHLPFPDYALGQNVLSAVFAALTIGIMYLLIYELTLSHKAAIITSASLALAHTFWWLAVINESYSLSFFLFSLSLLFFIRWWKGGKDPNLGVTFFSLGLALSNHYLTFLFIPLYVGFVLIKEPRILFKPLTITGVALAFILGAGLLVSIMTVSFLTEGASVSLRVLADKSILPFWRNPGKIVIETLKYSAYLFFQFPLIGFGTGLIGVWALKKKDFLLTTFLLILLLADVLFSAGYMWERQPEIMVPSYIIFALFLGMGAAQLEKQKWPKYTFSFILVSAALLPLLLYYSMPTLTSISGIRLLNPRVLPYRNNNYYFMVPDKRGYYGARRYGEEVMARAAPKALIFGDFTPLTVLRFLQTVEHKRPDIILQSVDSAVGEPLSLITLKKEVSNRPVYILDDIAYPNLYRTKELKEKYSLKHEGLLIRVLPKQ